MHLLRTSLLLGCLATVTSTFAQFTESPATVAPGEWLMETDVLSIAYDRHTPWQDGLHYRSSYSYVQITTGLAPNFDVQLGMDVWREERATGPGVDERVSGTGELYLRAKWNFWSSDALSVAVLPFVRIPGTADSRLRPDRTQWGVIVPWEMPLNERWTVGGQLQGDWLDDGMGGRAGWFTASAVASYTVSEKLGVYGEAMTYFSPKVERNWATLAGGGLTWQATENFSWDVGVMFGLTRIAPDFNPVLRFVWQL